MNGPFTTFLKRRLANTASLTSGTLKALLLRSTGTYTLNPDHLFVADLFSNGAVEITAGGYARATLSGQAVTQDDANNRAVLDFDDLVFGVLSAGQTVSAIAFFEFITNDAASPLMYYIDGKTKVIANAPATASNSGTITAATKANPCVITSTAHGLANGQKVYISSVGGMTQINNLVFTVAGGTTNTFQLSGVNSTAYTTYTSGGTWNTVQTVYVEKLRESIAAGTAVSFGGVTGTVRVDAVKGDRSLGISGLSGSIALGDSAEVQSVLNLPIALGSGAFTVKINAAGFLALPSSY